MEKDKNKHIASEAFIRFDGGTISYSYTVLTKEIDGRVALFIPSYKLFLSVKNKDEVREKSQFMVRSFYDFYVKQNGWKSLMLEIHKLGFRTKNHDLVMKNLLNGKPAHSKFNQSTNINSPDNFNMSDAEALQMEETIPC